jgi:hypothetical protein
MMDRRARPLPPEREQLELFDPGESVVPVELAIGTRRARRSSTRAWMMLVAIESSRSHSELRTAWLEVGRARANGVLDRPMYELLSDAWERRSHALRAARITAVTPANDQRKGARR